ncbi:hypothetical protein AZE42_12669 [Rhizopogon vesiculosus]|uniref:Uncharacterized protein n=1 Tax=Rhizopogon vesiculosus TaxID=180088 RepID=A0A1J8PME2_9AGAM|nr:hypothetical protein AZE42_12669 [Rhizopogon vesiculosus]
MLSADISMQMISPEWPRNLPMMVISTSSDNPSTIP